MRNGKEVVSLSRLSGGKVEPSSEVVTGISLSRLSGGKGDQGSDQSLSRLSGGKGRTRLAESPL